MSEWRTYTIDEIKATRKNAIAMGPFGSRIKKENFVSSGVPVIKGQNLNGDYLLENEFDFLTEEKADELMSSNALRGDLVITHRGTIGQVGLIPRNCKYSRYVVSQSQLKITLNTKIAYPEFVYYFFKTKTGQHRLLMNAAQVGVPAIARASTSVKAIPIELPPLPEQKVIAHILGTLDDKIELNRKMNQTLEAMAQALFKSWFVDFDPVLDNVLAAGNPIPEALEKKATKRKLVDDSKKLLHTNPELASLFPSGFEWSEELEKWVPEGWETPKIGDCDIYISDFVANGSFASLKQNVTLFPDETEYALFLRNTDLKSGFAKKVYVDKHSYEFLKKSRLFGGEVIISNVGDVGSVYRCPDLDIPMTLGNNVIMLNSCFNNYLFQYFKSYLGQALIDGIKGGSAQPKFNKTDFKSQNILIPTTSILEGFERLDALNRSKQESIKVNIQTLTQLRDTLLPQLISGKLRVSQEIINS